MILILCLPTSVTIIFYRTKMYFLLFFLYSRTVIILQNLYEFAVVLAFINKCNLSTEQRFPFVLHFIKNNNCSKGQTWIAFGVSSLATIFCLRNKYNFAFVFAFIGSHIISVKPKMYLCTFLLSFLNNQKLSTGQVCIAFCHSFLSKTIIILPNKH